MSEEKAEHSAQEVFEYLYEQIHKANLSVTFVAFLSLAWSVLLFVVASRVVKAEEEIKQLKETIRLHSAEHK